MGRIFFPILFFLVSELLQGCTPSERTATLKNFQLPMPTKDDVALVNGRPFSVGQFLTIRSSLNHPNDERAYWIGIAALAIQNENNAKGRDISFPSAVTIARYALKDISAAEIEFNLKEFNFHPTASSDETRNEIESILNKSIIQKSSQNLSQLF